MGGSKSRTAASRPVNVISVNARPVSGKRRLGVLRPAAFILCLLIGGAVFWGSLIKAKAKPRLQVVFGTNGIQQLSYEGVMLEDLAQNPADAFHVWHMKCTDMAGKVITTGQYGWGENHHSRSWDPATHTWVYLFDWGSILVHFVQSGDTLNMNVTETNYANSGVVFDGATIYPFVLHFPDTPIGFGNEAYAHLNFNTDTSMVTVADFGKGAVAALASHVSGPLYSGFEPAGHPNAFFPIISSTAMDDLASFLPHNDRPVQPGGRDTFTVSLRFAPSGTPVAAVAGDVLKKETRQVKPQLHWADRRIIGTAYLASSPQGDPSQPNGFSNNPRRYFNDSNSNDLDIRTPEGLAKFQAKILLQAHKDVENLKKLDAQGMITWDIEGEQYPQNTSYVCAPDEISQIAPEMESTIDNPASPYKGMKLDDAYFKIVKEAGFRVGVCIRPQHFAVYADGTASQLYLPNSQLKDEMVRKMQFAHDRWGATLFYVDSDVNSDGATMDASIFQPLAAAFPDSLIIPEHSTPTYYAYTAPFKTFLFHDQVGTPQDVYSIFPKAFSAVLVNDADASSVAKHRAELTDSVRRGDILMLHADYWQANNPTATQIYKEAGGGSAR